MRTSDEAPAARLRDASAEAEVAEYLRAHGDFFERHPELLAELAIPHACGGAVSLVEYQVSVLKDQARELRRRLHALVANARENEDLSLKLHRLTLGLLEAGRLDEILATLYQALREEFGAELAAVRILAPPRSSGDERLGELVADPEAARALLAGALGADRPLCGRLASEQAAFLFPERAGEVRSAAIVALRAGTAFGVLALASSDPERYQPGMGTLFLRQLGELVARVVAHHVVTR